MSLDEFLKVKEGIAQDAALTTATKFLSSKFSEIVLPPIVVYRLARALGGNYRSEPHRRKLCRMFPDAELAVPRELAGNRFVRKQHVVRVYRLGPALQYLAQIAAEHGLAEEVGPYLAPQAFLGTAQALNTAQPADVYGAGGRQG